MRAPARDRHRLVDILDFPCVEQIGRNFLKVDFLIVGAFDSGI